MVEIHTLLDHQEQRAKAFVQLKNIAFVGLSSNPNHFSRKLFFDWKKQGVKLYGVNPHVDEVSLQEVYHSIADIPEKIEGVFIITPKETSKSVVQEALDLGIKNIWLHKGTGDGAVSQEAVNLINENNVPAVVGFCPYMFFESSNILHKIHHYFRKRNKKNLEMLTN